MNRVFIVVIICALAGAAFIYVRSRPEKPAQSDDTRIQYVALGDSYTIGEGVSESERWPNQLVRQLAAQNIALALTANPSRTGFTSQDLIDKELPILRQKSADFVTIQIGVNDYYQGVRVEQFEQNLTFIIDEVKRTLPQAKLLLVTIPDYGKTPFGAQSGNPETIAVGIQEFNAIIVATGAMRNIPVADVFAISQAANAQNKIAPDGLHPSGEQYADWLTVIEPAAALLLKN